MKKTFLFVFIITFGSFCQAQSSEFKEVIKHYAKEIKLPISAIHTLPIQDTVDRALLNKVLFDQQAQRAKFYSIDDSLYRVTTYGRIDEDSFDWTDASGAVTIKRSLTPKAYAIGHIPLAKSYYALVTKVVGVEVTYFDLYLFDKQGKLLSLVNLYESEYENLGEVNNIAKVLMQSSITKDGIIQRHEERFSVIADRKYQLQPDGRFKVISQNIEGEYEP